VVQPSTGRVYAAASVSMAQYSPAIFVTEYSGNLRQAAIINQDGTVNSPTNPAPRGTTVALWATGQGYVPGAPPDGVPASSAISASIPLRVNIGGAYLDSMPYDPSSDIPQNQWLSYSGLNTIPGFWQINFYIPHAVVPANKIALVIVGGNLLNADPNTYNAYINVK
jgi:uncharacterized protein (TIGR03437 family)